MVLSLSRKYDINKPFYKRIHEIDLLRGFLILLVVMDHLFYCFYNYGHTWYSLTQNEAFYTMFKTFEYYWNSEGRAFVRYCCLFFFAFLSGMSINFSRNPWQRAFILALLSLALGIGSNVLSDLPFMKESGTVYIDFNILGVLAISTFCYSLACLNKHRTYIFISFILFGFLTWWYIIPSLAYFYPNVTKHYFPILWDPQYAGKPQADWLPLFPYFMFYFIGVMCSRIFYSKRCSHFPRYEIEKPLCFMGRHSLLFYLFASGGFVAISELVTKMLEKK